MTYDPAAANLGGGLEYVQSARSATKAELDALRDRVTDLERLWRIALKNPDLIRELALQALGEEPAER